MAEVYFHYSNADGLWTGQCATDVRDLADARDRAALFVRSLIMMPGEEDWRSWILHVSDASGEEILSLPFASLLGKPH